MRIKLKNAKRELSKSFVKRFISFVVFLFLIFWIMNYLCLISLTNEIKISLYIATLSSIFLGIILPSIVLLINLITKIDKYQNFKLFVSIFVLCSFLNIYFNFILFKDSVILIGNSLGILSGAIIFVLIFWVLAFIFKKKK